MRRTDETKDRVSRAGGLWRTTNIDINQVSAIQHKMSCGTRAGIWKTWNPQGYELRRRAGGVSRAAGALGPWDSEFSKECLVGHGHGLVETLRGTEEGRMRGKRAVIPLGRATTAGRQGVMCSNEEHDGRWVSGWGTRAGNLQNNDMGHLGRTWAVGQGRNEVGTGHNGHGAAKEDEQGLRMMLLLWSHIHIHGFCCCSRYGKCRAKAFAGS
ncbi:unnamed protein product [Calypogeia fissa]